MNDVCYPTTTGLISIEQARASMRTAILPVSEVERIGIEHAHGRILATRVRSAIAIPPQRNAAMDGYAFNGHALPPADDASTATLTIVGTAWAGQPFDGELKPGECVRILTGAVVPDTADSVIAQEQVERHDGNITFPRSLPLFKNIRPAGSDVALDEVLIDAPQKLGARHLALLASAGIGHIDVYRRLKIAFFSTGDELVDVTQTLKTGQIYDSNRYLLSGLLHAPNHVVTDLGIVADQPERLERLLSDAATHHDVIISTGGVSVGDADFVKQTLARCGKLDFWQLAIKPGKPLTFGRIGECWFIGLPGNPVAVWVTYEQFVKPALQQLAGAAATQKLRLPARCLDTLRKTAGRQEYQRGILQQSADGSLSVKRAGGQDSHQMQAASRANCLIVLDVDCQGIEIGESVWVEPLSTEL